MDYNIRLAKASNFDDLTEVAKEIFESRREKDSKEKLIWYNRHRIETEELQKKSEEKDKITENYNCSDLF